MKKIFLWVLGALGIGGWICTAILAYQLDKEVDESIENYNDASSFSTFIRIHEDDVREKHKLFGLTEYSERAIKKAHSKKYEPWKYRE